MRTHQRWDEGSADRSLRDLELEASLGSFSAAQMLSLLRDP
jgi:hypothetical protein